LQNEEVPKEMSSDLQSVRGRFHRPIFMLKGKCDVLQEEQHFANGNASSHFVPRQANIFWILQMVKVEQSRLVAQRYPIIL
jgi:hypothetical protein